MCPQPLSRISKSGNYILSNDPLTAVPETGALIARAIAGWAMIEALQGDAFVSLIGGKNPVTMSMYTALTSPELRQKLFQAAATELLPAKYASLLADALTVLERLGQKRHKFAHWLWGRPTDPHLSGALVLVEPKHHWRHLMAAAKHWSPRHARKQSFGQRWATHPRLDPDFIFVYRPQELRQICEEMERGFKQALMLYEMIGAKAPRRRELYTQLYAEPEIRAACSQRLKKSPKAFHSKRPKS